MYRDILSPTVCWPRSYSKLQSSDRLEAALNPPSYRSAGLNWGLLLSAAAQAYLLIVQVGRWLCARVYICVSVRVLVCVCIRVYMHAGGQAHVDKRMGLLRLCC